MGVTDRAHINAHQFKLGADICAGKRKIATTNMTGCVAAHGIARCHQAEDKIIPQGIFTNGINIRIRCLALVIDHNTAALTDSQVKLTSQGVLGAVTAENRSISVSRFSPSAKHIL